MGCTLLESSTKKCSYLIIDKINVNFSYNLLKHGISIFTRSCTLYSYSYTHYIYKTIYIIHRTRIPIYRVLCVHFSLYSYLQNLQGHVLYTTVPYDFLYPGGIMDGYQPTTTSLLPIHDPTDYALF